MTGEQGQDHYNNMTKCTAHTGRQHLLHGYKGWRFSSALGVNSSCCSCRSHLVLCLQVDGGLREGGVVEGITHRWQQHHLAG